MSLVTEGPALDRDFLRNDFKAGLGSFALRLEKALSAFGADVGLLKVFEGGSRISSLEGAVQLHVSEETQEAIDALAASIMERVGRGRFSFAKLVMPNAGLIAVSDIYTRRVAVRYIRDYRVGTDSEIERWDVLVVPV